MVATRTGQAGQGTEQGCASCVGPTGRLETLRVARAFPLGRPDPLRIEVRTLGCRACGRVRDSNAVERAFELEICRSVVLSGAVNAHTFRLLRQVTRLSTVEAGEVLLLDPGTLSRWENGHRACDERAWVVMALAAFDVLGTRPPPVRTIMAAIQDPKPFSAVSLSV